MGKKRVKFIDQIRLAVSTCGLTRYQIWQRTGIDQSVLSKFVGGKAGLSMESLDALADLLGLNVTTGKVSIKSKSKRKGG